VKVLFDQNVPRPLSRFLSGHVVVRAVELGWEELSNGELIASAEAQGFDVMVTADRNLRYQQNLTGRKLAIVVLPSGRWPRVKMCISEIVQAVNSAAAGAYIEIRTAQTS
jgi:predicted nuclease of predicted toxin-antitoxin system